MGMERLLRVHGSTLESGFRLSNAGAVRRGRFVRIDGICSLRPRGGAPPPVFRGGRAGAREMQDMSEGTLDHRSGVAVWRKAAIADCSASCHCPCIQSRIETPPKGHGEATSEAPLARGFADWG